jgi:hypothetical protein
MVLPGKPGELGVVDQYLCSVVLDTETLPGDVVIEAADGYGEDSGGILPCVQETR